MKYLLQLKRNVLSTNTYNQLNHSRLIIPLQIIPIETRQLIYICKSVDCFLNGFCGGKMTNKRCFRQTLMAESRQKRLTCFFNSQIIFQQRWTLTAENLHKKGENESNNQMHCVKQSQQSETRITTKRSPHSVQKVWAHTHTTSIDFPIRPSPLYFFSQPPTFESIFLTISS